MTDYHEPWDALPADARDIHRALTSLKEEIEAIDWYNQRVALCSDPELRDVLAHNRDEEIEHAVMTLEWLRRNMNGWNRQLLAHLFKEGPIAHEEDEGEAAARPERSLTEPLGVGLGIGRRR